jgi:hypothetical protein
MLIAQDDASAVEDPPDSRIELARDLRLGPPHGTQDRRHVQRRDLMDRALEQRAGIGRTEMALPLVADFRVYRLALRVSMTSLAISLKVGIGLVAFLAALSASIGSTPRAMSFLASLARSRASLRPTTG